MARVTLRAGQTIINGKVIFANKTRNDGVAVADRLSIVNDVGKLPAGRGRGIEDVLMGEWHAGQFEEGVHFEAVAVVIGDTKKLRVGVQSKHCASAEDLA